MIRPASRLVTVAVPERRLFAVGTRASKTGMFSPRDASVRLLDSSADPAEEVGTICDLDSVTALAHNNSRRLLAVGTDGGSTFVYGIDDPNKPEKLTGVPAFHAIQFTQDPTGLPTPEVAQLV